MINNDPLKIGVVPLPMEWIQEVILPGPGWDAATHRREHPQEPLQGAVTQLVTMSLDSYESYEVVNIFG